MTASKTLLGAGAVLHRGEKLVSPSGKVEAVLQDDGNFVVYVDKKDVWARSEDEKGKTEERKDDCKKKREKKN